jgi:two-component system LytT family sensor kinase
MPPADARVTTPEHPRHSRLRRTLTFLGIWTFLALFFATKFYYAWKRGGAATTWTKHLWWQTMEWYSWAIFSIAIFWLLRRFEHERKRGRYALLLLGSAVVFALAHVLVLTTGARIEAAALETGKTWLELLVIVFTNHFHSDVFTYAAIVSCWHAVNYFRKYREGEAEAARLQTALAESRLQALRHQLQPHFLFNTLHSISTLNHEDPKAANRMIARLSELLRFTLEANDQQIPLRQEIEFIRRYLEIEQIRFGQRLHVRIDLAPDVLDAQVPTLLLQPLVENAIRHGIAPYSAPGEIVISAHRQNDTLYITVGDTGPGLNADANAAKNGVGLTNTRARLEQLYGNQHRFELRNGESRGLIAELHLPLTLAENSATPKA